MREEVRGREGRRTGRWDVCANILLESSDSTDTASHARSEWGNWEHCGERGDATLEFNARDVYMQSPHS